jgi:methylase of polypeptide subunit release factors
MEALERDLNTLRTILPSTPVVLEIGSGSGLVSSYIHRLLAASTISHDNEHYDGQSSEFFKPRSYAVDLNPHAVAATRATAELNATPCTVRESDLDEAVKDELSGTPHIRPSMYA